MDNKHYNLLIPSEVTSLSNIIASVIYNTANTKNVHESAERFNALTLIRNLCLNQTNHYPVNSTNYYCFLDRIKDNFQTSFEEFAALPHVSPIMSVIQHYKQLMELHVERERWRDLIHRHDLKKCLSDYFTRKLTFFYDCVIDLKAIDETLNCFIVEVNHKDSPKVEKKGDHIGLAYALLNFKTSKANTILCALLQRLALNKPLEENELAFLNYLWNNFDCVDETVQDVFVDNFKFVYEKSVIEASEEVVKSNTTGITPGMQTVFKLCLANRKLSFRVKSMLYTLFRYSDFNLKIYHLIKGIDF